MSKIRWISDIHFNHKNIILKRGFDDIEAYNEMIIENWNGVTTKRDTTFLVGDISMDNRKVPELLKRLRGTIILVAGNHDHYQRMKWVVPHVHAIAGAVHYKGYIITHIPIHPQEFYRWHGNIHGHTHWNHVTKGLFKKRDSRYINVSCDVINYTPVELKLKK